MKKITCISYHNSGSGAVDDYLREFCGIAFAPSDVECRFLQDPYGISDLEYALIDNWHRLNSGFAIKKYQKFAKDNKRTYRLIFGQMWDVISQQYIDSLITFKFPGYWHADINEQPFLSRLVFKLRRAVSKVMPKKYRKTQDFNYFPKIQSYHSRLTREDFYSKTQLYCEHLCEQIADTNTDYVVLDQCVPTTNIKRYLNYISDLKVIIVDRDPRDLYIQGTRGGTHVLPHDPKLFAMQYIDMRRTEKEELTNPNVMRIQFEDLVYHYNETTHLINEFLGLDEKKHIQKYKYFNPNISVKNTQIWKSDPRFEAELKIIEEYLSSYYYDFEKETKNA